MNMLWNGVLKQRKKQKRKTSSGDYHIYTPVNSKIIESLPYITDETGLHK